MTEGVPVGYGEAAVKAVRKALTGSKLRTCQACGRKYLEPAYFKPDQVGTTTICGSVRCRLSAQHST